MKKLILLTICLTSIVVRSEVGIDPQPPSSTTLPTTTPSTTTPSTTTPSTTTPSTTTPSTTTSSTTTPATTTHSTTTSTTPKTTTPTPTTPIPTTPSPTTPSPTTPSPTTPSPTTPSPTPSDPQVGTWTVKNETTNNTCIIVKMAMKINVTYSVNGSNTWKSINLPVNETHSTGYCHNSSQQIALMWMGNKNVSNKILFDFVENTTSKTFKLSTISVSLEVNSELFPGLNNVSTIDVFNNSGVFITSLHRSYKCDRIEKLNMTSDKNNSEAIVVLSISHLQLQAFHSASDEVFSTAEDCEMSDTPDIVPIAVGCALAGLVIVVLVAYLIGRRRSQARGYLSM